MLCISNRRSEHPALFRQSQTQQVKTLPLAPILHQVTKFQGVPHDAVSPHWHLAKVHF